MDSLTREIFDLEQQIKELQSSLANERVSNLQYDLIQKEQKQKINDLKDCLAQEKLKNQSINQQLQEYQINTEKGQIQIQQLQSIVIQQQTQIHQLQIKYTQQTNYIQQQQQQQQQMYQSMNVHDNAADEDEFSGKYDTALKLDDDESDNETADDDKEMRLQLLETQMQHEKLKSEHRKSIAKLEDYELRELGISNTSNNSNNNPPEKIIKQLNEQLNEQKKKTESLDKERRNSLAQLSQNMFKKLLDAEHQHYDQTSNLEKKCNELSSTVQQLTEQKEKLAIQTNKTIDELREHIKLLSMRLRKYETWE